MSDERSVVGGERRGIWPAVLASVALGAGVSACGAAQTHSPARRHVSPAPRHSPPVVPAAPQSVYVPGVAGEPVAKTRAALASAGLVSTVVDQPSTTIPAGVVIATAPPAFSYVNKGRAVKLLVSTGPSKVTLPSLIGYSQTGAEGKLTSEGLRVVVTERSGSGPPGNVVAQAPPAGAMLTLGATEQITVSTALPTVTVPNLLNESEERAVVSASKLGFMIALRTQAVVRAARDRIVLAQSQPAGAKVARGAVLTLTVGVYRPSKTAKASSKDR